MTKLQQIRGLHHVTSLAASANANNAFFTRTLGLRRVKKTVNFDAPEVYHLYYGDEVGMPGTVMTYFPFPDIARGRPGTGEVGETVFSAVPEGAIPFWLERLERLGVDGVKAEEAFGEKRLHFAGPTATASPWSKARLTRARPGRGAASTTRTPSAAFIRPRRGCATRGLPPKLSGSWVMRRPTRP